MISALISEFGPWNWWLLGIILLALEVVLPGVFLMFFGLAALFVGLVTVVIGDGAVWWPWQVQIIAFCVLSLASAVVGKKFWSSKKIATDEPNLNDRGAGLIGKSTVLIDPIQNGRGRIKLGDTVWMVAGPDLPSGTKVEVIGSSANTLNVTELPSE